jgi:hypothetical protein
VQPSRYPSTSDDDPLIGLAAAARLVPGRGVAPAIHPSTLSRWITKGANTSNGRVRLRAIKCGAAWALRPSWLQEYIDALTTDRIGTTALPPRSPAAARRDSERAARTLIAGGY